MHPSSFPGMDPYLEEPTRWPGVHTRLIALIADTLAPQLAPAFTVAIVEPLEAEEVRERYLEIRDTRTRAVITTIEVVSPPTTRCSVAARPGHLMRSGWQRSRGDCPSSPSRRGCPCLTCRSTCRGWSRQCIPVGSTPRRSTTVSLFRHRHCRPRTPAGRRNRSRPGSSAARPAPEIVPQLQGRSRTWQVHSASN